MWDWQGNLCAYSFLRSPPLLVNSLTGPHLDAAHASRRDLRGELDGFIQVPGVNQIETRPTARWFRRKGPSLMDTLPLRTRTVVAV